MPLPNSLFKRHIQWHNQRCSLPCKMYCIMTLEFVPASSQRGGAVNQAIFSLGCSIDNKAVHPIIFHGIHCTILAPIHMPLARIQWEFLEEFERPQTATVSFRTIYFLSFHSLSQSLFTPVVKRVGWTGAKGALVNPSACFVRGAYSFLKLVWGSVMSPMWEASECQSQIWPPTNYLTSWIRLMECTGVDFVQLKLSTPGSCLETGFLWYNRAF